MQFGLRPKTHDLGRRQAVRFGLRCKTHGLNGCDPCNNTSDLTSGEVWRLRGVVGVTRPPSTPKDGAITTQNRLPNMIDHGTDI